MTDNIITISMTREEADRLSFALSDLLCWIAGFKAALSREELDRSPVGYWAARDINIKIKSAMPAETKF